MKSSRPLLLIGTLGALSASAGATDTSLWKCESCPFESGTSGVVDVGAGAVSDTSAPYGDYTGLNRQGGFLIAGGAARYRGDDGLYARLAASDLGLDSRSLAAEGGREGRYALRLGYSELPRHLSTGAMTPFIGAGSAVQTLPAGFPAASTDAMPLATTLQPVELGFKRRLLDIGASMNAAEHWTYRVSARHEVRDGTRRVGGSFFSSTSQLVAPVDQVTDQLEVSASYATRQWQASLAYHASMFRNRADSLTWANPFTAGSVGAASGQLAPAPDNQFHRVVANAGVAISPSVRASAEVALGRMTQDSAYLAATLNPSLGVPALPASSLHGSVATLDASLRLSATPTERLRLNASLTRDERNNHTPVAAYPAVSTDMFLGVNPRSNVPYSFTQDRLKLGADYRGPGHWKLAAGAEHDSVHRTLQETGATREATLWTRVSAKPLDKLSLSLKLTHAERKASDYSPVAAIDPAENPLLRKYNQADRRRDGAALRADLSLSETVNLGVGVDIANDDYRHSAIGLTRSRSADVSADLSVAVSDDTQLHAYAQGESIRSLQSGSQQGAQADWSGRVRDGVRMVGAGLTHSALKGRLELSGNLAVSRSRSNVTVDAGVSSPPFPSATHSLDSVTLAATYRLNDKLSLIGNYAYERSDTRDWHLDGVLPATVPNLLAFGEQAPRYSVHVVRMAVRYRFY